MSGWQPAGFFSRAGGFRLGADDRPPRLVLLPGIEGDARIFCRMTPLAARRPVAALDLPRGRRISELADSIAALLPDDPVVLFGASLGGLVGWSLSRRHPGRVAGLITLGSLPDPGSRPRRIGPAAAVLSRLPASVFSLLYERRIASRMAEEGVEPELAARLLASLPGRDVLSERLESVAAFSPEGPPTATTLWLRGQLDQEIRWNSITVQQALPGVGIEIVPGGHRAHLTHPQPLMAVIDHFCRSLNGRGQ